MSPATGGLEIAIGLDEVDARIAELNGMAGNIVVHGAAHEKSEVEIGADQDDAPIEGNDGMDDGQNVLAWDSDRGAVEPNRVSNYNAGETEGGGSGVISLNPDEVSILEQVEGEVERRVLEDYATEMPLPFPDHNFDNTAPRDDTTSGAEPVPDVPRSSPGKVEFMSYFSKFLQR